MGRFILLACPFLYGINVTAIGNPLSRLQAFTIRVTIPATRFYLNINDAMLMSATLRKVSLELSRHHSVLTTQTSMAPAE